MIKTVTAQIDKTEKMDYRIFLAGTIDQGKSYNWQEEIITRVKRIPFIDQKKDLIIYNPRYSGLGYKVDIHDQIKWEQEHLDRSDCILMYLEGNGSPISLLELGLYSKSEKLFVYVEKNFYRTENIQETCKKYGIPVFFGSREECLNRIIDKIQSL